MITKLTPGVLLPPDHRHEFKILIPITLLDMTTITVCPFLYCIWRTDLEVCVIWWTEVCVIYREVMFETLIRGMCYTLIRSEVCVIYSSEVCVIYWSEVCVIYWSEVCVICWSEVCVICWSEVYVILMFTTCNIKAEMYCLLGVFMTSLIYIYTCS